MAKRKLNYGRKRIILNYDEVTPKNFKEVFAQALPFFESNKKDCEYLIGVFLGDQDILRRPAPNTSNINNKTVVNYAYPITREIVGYTFGNPFELVQQNTEDEKDVQKLSDIYEYEGAYTIDTNTAIFASICGFGYQITLPSKDINEDNTPETPLIMDSLDPRHTFVVQSSNVGNQQIMSCIEIVDSTGRHKQYIAFTNKHKFIVDGLDYSKATVETNPVGLDPITMFENSAFLTVDWEQAIPVMNSMNQLISDSLNDVEGTIKSLLVLLGTELEDPATKLSDIKDKRLLTLANGNGVAGPLDAKFISPSLDSAEIQEIRTFLNDARNIITGVPDRDNTASGDTGAAVINRNGWTDIEIVARLKELYFKRAKKKQVAIALKILQSLGIIPKTLSVMDIKVDISRNTLDNLSTKAAAFSTLVATGELATIDALDFSGLTNRTSEVVARGEIAKEERIKRNLELGLDPNASSSTSGKYNYSYSYDRKNDGNNAYNENKKNNSEGDK